MTERLRFELAAHPAGRRVTVLDDIGAEMPQQGVAVALLSQWTPAEVIDLGQRAADSAATVVPLRFDGQLTVMGPAVGRGLPGCLVCAEDARLRISGPMPGDPTLQEFGGTPVPALLPLLAAMLVEAEGESMPLTGKVWMLRGSDLTASVHSIRSRPGGCPQCSPVPDDSPEAVRLTPAARPLPRLGELRQPNPATSGGRLRHELLDPRHGPVLRLQHTDGLAVPLVTAAFAIGGSAGQAGYGRAITVSEAERTALFEAVERQNGLRPHGRRTVLTASFTELGAHRAVDPASLGLHDPRYHDHPAFGLTPYHPELTTQWVHGWSLTADRARAVPEQVAYYGVPRANSTRFLYESSNGCGLGNSPEEAALYGLLEVAERDAFLMAWYARTPLRLVAPAAEDPLVPHLVDLLHSIGYELMFFDATNDFGIPAVLALALHRDPMSGAPQALCAAGANPDPRIAIRSAAMEVATDVYTLPAAVSRRPEHRDRDRLLAMLDDPTLVRTLDDHVALHTLPEARVRFDFLQTNADDPVDWRDLWPDDPRPVTDLSRLLTDMVARLAASGMEVVVVDQTDPWSRDRLGLHSAKVLVPGALPMTFGHVYRRTSGLPRLLEVPAMLGRSPAVLDHDELDLYPHPFP